MKRNLLLVGFLSFSVFTAQSQIEAKEGKLKINKTEKNAAVVEVPYPTEVVEEAIKKQFALSGIKPDKSNGFQVFRAVKLDDSDDELNDLYFKVERKSNKEKNVSIVHLVVAPRGHDIGAKTSDGSHKASTGITFLNRLVPSVESHNLHVDIEKQDEVVRKAEKKLEDLKVKQEEIEKNIKKLQEKLEENMRSQEKQAEEVATQKKIQDAMKARRQN